MTRDKYDKFRRLYADIGGEVAEIVDGDPDGTFLYAEAGEGWLGASVFKDEGRTFRYFDPSPALIDLLLQAWKTEIRGPRMRRSVMEYEITGTRFDVRFQYPDEVEVKSFADNDRRESALKRRYGEKPVIYPPIPEHLLRGASDED